MNGEKKNGEAWALFLLFVRRAWIEVPANSDGLPVNAFVKTTKSRLHFKSQGEYVLSSDALFAFLRHFLF